MKRILVTRPRAQADSLVEGLRAAGFEPIYFPVIEIRSVEDHSKLDQALEQINKYDWVVFTSVNGVEAVFDRLEKYSSLPRVAAIGPKTAEALKARGVIPDFIPEEYVAEAILPGLGDLRGRQVLLPRAEIARKALPEAIIKAGGTAHEIAVYKTLALQPDAEGLAALKAGVDVITLTSPSTVQNFVAIARQNGFNPLNLPNNPLFACIGPITEQTAREEGLSNLIVAKEYTADGLIQILSDLVNS
jgi:uroporphyrinogen-III synthase